MLLTVAGVGSGKFESRLQTPSVFSLQGPHPARDRARILKSIAQHWARDLICVPVFEVHPPQTDFRDELIFEEGEERVRNEVKGSGERGEEERVIAVIQIANKNNNSLNEIDLELAISLASHVAVSIGVANHLESLEERLEEHVNAVIGQERRIKSLENLERKLANFMQACKHLQRTDGLRGISKTTSEAIPSLLDCEGALLFLGCHETDKIWSVASDGSARGHFALGLGITGSCFITGKMHNISLPSTDPNFVAEIDERSVGRIHSILCIPLKTNQGEVFGVLQLANKRSNSLVRSSSTTTASSTSSSSSSSSRSAMKGAYQGLAGLVNRDVSRNDDGFSQLDIHFSQTLGGILSSVLQDVQTSTKRKETLKETKLKLEEVSQELIREKRARSVGERVIRATLHLDACLSNFESDGYLSLLFRCKEDNAVLSSYLLNMWEGKEQEVDTQHSKKEKL